MGKKHKKKPISPKAHWKAGRTNRSFGTNTSGNAGPNQANLPYLPLLRARSRDMARNAPVADNAVDTYSSELIGVGITPLPDADDTVKKELSALWDEWREHADFDKVLDFYGLQDLATRAWKESGECFARLIVLPYDGNGIVPLRIQLIEADMIPLANGKAPSGNEIFNGIEFKDGQRIAYWMLKKHPGDYPFAGRGAFGVVDYKEDNMVRVPADEMLHLYKPRRPGQLRGVPRLSGTLQTISQLDDFDEATLERQKIAAALTAFIRRPEPIEPGKDPITGEKIDPDVVQESTLHAGSGYTLLPGEEITFPDLPELGEGYEKFVKHYNQKIASGNALPYELLTGDYSAVNDRTVRVALGVFRRKLQQDQRHNVIHQFCRPVWRKWIQIAVLNALAIRDYIAVKVKWNPQAWPYINPLQDVQTKDREIKAGLTSRTAKIMERGDDPDQVDKERAADKEREQELQISQQVGKTEGD